MVRLPDPFRCRGALFDRVIFRPLIGWATAWSFDRLRLWLEERLDPQLAIRQTAIHLVARLSLAAVFAYQGLVPFAALLVVAWTQRWPAWLSLLAMPIAAAIVGFRSPSLFVAALNPFSLNATVAALAAIDLLVLAGVPSATHCKRRPDER